MVLYSTAICVIFLLTFQRCDGFVTMSDGRQFLQEGNSSTSHPVEAGPEGDLPFGKYTSRGYGFAVEVGENGVTVYDESSMSCIDTSDEELLQALEDFQLNGTVLTGSLHLRTYHFDNVNVFPGACADGVTIVDGNEGYEYNALTNFDILKTTFSEQYAFFEQRDIDWEALATQARANLAADSSSTKLLEAFKSVLDPLEDGHVELVVIEEGEEVEFYSSNPLGIDSRLQEEFVQQSEIDDYTDFQNLFFGSWLQTLSGYMEDGINGDTDALLWGKFAHTNVGYIMMLGFATEDEPAFMQIAIDAFSTLKTTDSLIFDIRVNGGGDLYIPLLMASIFANERTAAFSTKAWDPKSPTGFTTEERVHFEPNASKELHYDGDVVIMVSGSTVSAAEIFTIAMAQLPQVTVFGRPTSGSFSSILEKSLPNGWRFGLSNVVIATPDGVVHEVVGFPPDVETQTDLLPLVDLQNGQDTWLEEALSLVKASIPSTSPTNIPTTPTPTSSPIESPASEPPMSTPMPTPSLTESPASDSPATQAPALPSPASASFVLVPGLLVFVLTFPTFVTLL